MIFIIGGKGLTGSAVVRYCRRNGLDFEVIQRDNASAYSGRACDTLVYANGNARKWKANQDPLFDFAETLGSTVGYVHSISCSHYVQISTVDVYPQKTIAGTREEMPVNPQELDNYGFHKYLAEEYVKHFFPQNHLILRLPGLVGPGLRKNPAFDFAAEHKKVMISADSRLNFLHTDDMADILFHLLRRRCTGVWNVAASDSIRIGDLSRLWGRDSEYTLDAWNYRQNYEINTAKLAELVPLSTSAQAVKKYFDSLQVE